MAVDNTAVYFALATIALVVVLSGLVISARRLMQSPERRAHEARLSPSKSALYLGGAMVFLFLLITVPLVGLGLLIAGFVWSIIEINRMPAKKKELFYQRIAEHQQKPLAKFVNSISLVIILLLIVVGVWGALTW